MADLNVHLESSQAVTPDVDTSRIAPPDASAAVRAMTIVIPDQQNATIVPLIASISPSIALETASSLKPHRLLREWHALWEQQKPPCPEIEPDVALSRMSEGETDSWVFFLIEEDGQLATVVGGFIAAAKRKIRLGYRSVLLPSLRAFTLFNDGVLHRGGDDTFDLMGAWIREQMESQRLDLACFRHLATEHPFHSAMNRHLEPLTRTTRRDEDQWLCDLDHDDPESWMQKHGRKTRYNIRRETRMLEEVIDGAATPLCYVDVADVDGFVQAADAISAHSYQSGIGVGVRDTSRWVERLRHDASHGRFVAYVLHGPESPLAYMLGERWGDRVRLIATAFDQRYETISPGKVLLRRAIEDLATTQRATLLDFGFGDAAYKRLFGTRVVPQVSRAYFAKRGKAHWVYRTEAVAKRLNDAVSGFAERHGLYDQIKRRARERVQRKRPNKPSG